MQGAGCVRRACSVRHAGGRAAGLHLLRRAEAVQPLDDEAAGLGVGEHVPQPVASEQQEMVLSGREAAHLSWGEGVGFGLGLGWS